MQFAANRDKMQSQPQKRNLHSSSGRYSAKAYSLLLLIEFHQRRKINRPWAILSPRSNVQQGSKPGRSFLGVSTPPQQVPLRTKQNHPRRYCLHVLAKYSPKYLLREAVSKNVFPYQQRRRLKRIASRAVQTTSATRMQEHFFFDATPYGVDLIRP